MKMVVTNISGIFLASRYDYQQFKPSLLSAWKKQPDTRLLADTISTLKISVMSSKNTVVNFYCCTVHSDIHTVHSPTDARSLKLW